MESPATRQVPFIPKRSRFHELTEDVVHGEVDGVPLRHDHYRVLGREGLVPGIVFVHGGGWRNGDPSQAAGNALHFARRGISTVSISYRLAPEHPFPAAVHDVRRGLRWVRAHAEELGIDPERIALLGLSAGAHLALLVHLTSDHPELLNGMPEKLADVSEEVRALVLHYGVYDLRDANPLPGGDHPVGEFLGPDPGAVENLASPILHVEACRAPVLLVHGTADGIVSHRQSVRLHEALQAAGSPSELVLLDGAFHAFQLDWEGEANRQANAAMDAFLDRTLSCP